MSHAHICVHRAGRRAGAGALLFRALSALVDLPFLPHSQCLKPSPKNRELSNNALSALIGFSQHSHVRIAKAWIPAAADFPSPTPKRSKAPLLYHAPSALAQHLRVSATEHAHWQQQTSLPPTPQ